MVITFFALFFGFRSVLVAAKAVALNLLTVAAAGALVLVFRTARDRAVRPRGGTGRVFTIVPILAFCIVFGLSMDYEVFLVSRVAEARRSGLSEDEAIVEGLARTGSVITSAGSIMIAVFASFAMGAFLPIQMLGFVLTVAVLLDATVVRMVIGPALLRLAGKWNWWPGRVDPGPESKWCHETVRDFSDPPPRRVAAGRDRQRRQHSRHRRLGRRWSPAAERCLPQGAGGLATSTAS
jgi:RND superfamily putative drug exporter